MGGALIPGGVTDVWSAIPPHPSGSYAPAFGSATIDRHGCPPPARAFARRNPPNPAQR